jgi:hypothetical protein
MPRLQARRTNLWRTIALAGLCAGALDIADALIFFGIRGASPTRILQGIAFGLIGQRAYSIGPGSALLGLLLHLLIATLWAALYVLASTKLPLAQRPLMYGTIYGIVIYLAMNYIVLPLSHIGLRPLPPLPALINGVAALIVCVGIPIALIARKVQPDSHSI